MKSVFINSIDVLLDLASSLYGMKPKYGILRNDEKYFCFSLTLISMRLNVEHFSPNSEMVLTDQKRLTCYEYSIEHFNDSFNEKYLVY